MIHRGSKSFRKLHKGFAEEGCEIFIFGKTGVVIGAAPVCLAVFMNRFEKIRGYIITYTGTVVTSMFRLGRDDLSWIFLLSNRSCQSFGKPMIQSEAQRFPYRRESLPCPSGQVIDLSIARSVSN